MEFASFSRASAIIKPQFDSGNVWKLVLYIMMMIMMMIAGVNADEWHIFTLSRTGG